MRRVAVLLAGATLSDIACAHGVPLSGATAFVEGLWLPLSFPEPILGMLGLGVVLGQQSARGMVHATTGYCGGIALGWIAAGLTDLLYAPRPWFLMLALVVGGVAALGRMLPRVGALAAGAIGGLLVGSAAWLAQIALHATLPAFAGAVVGMSILPLAAGALAFGARTLVRHPAASIAVRVAGSWIAAIAALLLALGAR